jgi:endonuclease G
MVSVDYQTWQQARTSLDRAITLHLGDPNVSHIDIGLRIRDKEHYRIEDELTVRVHLRKKLYGEAFEAFANKFPDRIVDARRIGFPVDIPEARYQFHYLWQWRPPNYSNSRRSAFNIMKGGISISNEWSHGYGTLGGKVIDCRTGETCILSNWHVLVGSWAARPGLAIYQPAQGDGGTAAHTVALLARDAMSQNIDAAIARLNGRRSLLNEQLDIGRVTGVASPRIGTRVMKSGRGSRVTQGIISGVEGQAIFRYEGLQRLVKHIIHIVPEKGNNEVSSGGDSGSWWVEKNTLRAVGLHFAGSNQPEYGLAIAMPPVLAALDVDIALS